MSWKEYIGTFAGIAVAGGVAAVVTHTIMNYKLIPKTDRVEPGYVVPSKLEIELQDLDNNGQNETILKYGGKPYLFMVDEQGKPVLKEYEVKPAEIVPK